MRRTGTDQDGPERTRFDEAKQRERVRKGNQSGADKCGNISTLDDTGKARDKAGAAVGVAPSKLGAAGVGEAEHRKLKFEKPKLPCDISNERRSTKPLTSQQISFVGKMKTASYLAAIRPASGPENPWKICTYFIPSQLKNLHAIRLHLRI